MIGLVFAVSVMGKLRGRGSYGGFVAATGRLGPGWMLARVPAGAVAGGVLAAEAAVPMLLVPPGTAWTGLALAGLLAAVFAVALLAARRRGDGAPCHCFGASSRPAGGVHVVRNAVLAAAAVLGTVAGALADGPPGPLGAVTATAAGVALAAVTVTADDVAELFRPAVPADGHRATKGLLR